MTMSRLGVATAVGLVVVGTMTVVADYKVNFQRGIQASNRRNWTEAIRYFEQALAEQSVETGENVQISGMDFKPYLPQFYLGVALMSVNDCAGALRAWRISESQAAIKNTRERRALVRNRGECERRVAKQPPPARDFATTVPPAPLPSPPSIAAVTVPLRNEAAPAPSAIGAGVAGNTQQTEETSAITPAAPVVTPRLDDLKPAVTNSPVAPIASAVVAPPAAVAAKSTPSPPQLAQKVRSVDRPPKELLTAAQFFFNREYQQAIGALAGLQYDSRPAATQAALFRAAALHALYLLGGEKDTGLRDRTSNEVRACRQLDPKLTPDPRVFSPRFIEFFGRTL